MSPLYKPLCTSSLNSRDDISDSCQRMIKPHDYTQVNLYLFCFPPSTYYLFMKQYVYSFRFCYTFVYSFLSITFVDILYIKYQMFSYIFTQTLCYISAIFLKQSKVWIKSFPFPRLVAKTSLKKPVCSIYPQPGNVFVWTNEFTSFFFYSIVFNVSLSLAY